MRILINRTDAIGDTLLSMPVAQLIKETYPEAQVAFLISPLCQDLFDNHPFVDKIYLLDKKQKFLKKVRILHQVFKEFMPDTYLYMGGMHLVSAYALMKKIPFRGGLKSRLLSFLFLNQGIRQKRSIVSMHEVDYNFELLIPLGIDHPKQKRYQYPPRIALRLKERSLAREAFNKDLTNKGHCVDKELIFIHPGMTGHTLNWSARNYARTIIQINSKYPGRFLFVISHTPSDEKYIKGVRDFFEEGAHREYQKDIYYFNGAVKGLRDYMAILSYAKIFIGPSTGTLHIANTLGIPSIGIYSPIRTQSSLRWGPFQRHSDVYTRIVVPDVVCGEQTKCIEASCPYYFCMDKVEVEDIVKEILPLMEKK